MSFQCETFNCHSFDIQRIMRRLIRIYIFQLREFKAIKKGVNLHSGRNRRVCVGCVCNDKVTILLSRSTSSAGRLRQDEIVSWGRWEPVYDTFRKERRVGREQDASGPMAIITEPLDGEIQMQVIGASYCIAMAPGSRSAFPFRRSPMRSSIVPCARRNLRKALNLRR